MTIDTAEFALPCGRVTVNIAKMETELCKRKYRDKLRPLTRRHFDVLVLLVAGYSLTQIGVMLKVRLHTLSQRKANIRVALDIGNDVELGMLAYERGWVSLELK